MPCNPDGSNKEHGVPCDQLLDGTVDVYREEFLMAVETVRALHDPMTEWALFRDTLWLHLARVFGVDTSEGWPEDLPDPVSGPGGDARAVAAWLAEQRGDFQRSAATPCG